MPMSRPASTPPPRESLAAPAAPAAQVQALLRDLTAYLRSLQEDGLVTVESSGVRRAAPAAPAPKPVRPVAPPPAPAPGPVAAGDTEAALRQVAAEAAACTRCGLHRTRTRPVPGQGAPHPDILFVGEAPGEDEDREGLAFVGAAGQLLTKMIEAMGYRREEVFIANVLKCRPPGNRTPAPDEMTACLPFLRRQIAALRPKAIVALGSVATHALVPSDATISRMRGHWYPFEGLALMPTFHPAYLLRNPSAKREAWADLQAVLQKLGRTPPSRPAAAG